jgi:hypothetical protein
MFELSLLSECESLAEFKEKKYDMKNITKDGVRYIILTQNGNPIHGYMIRTKTKVKSGMDVKIIREPLTHMTISDMIARGEITLK